MKNFLKEIRRARGLSLEMLSERTDYAISTINNFENDRTPASTRFIERMAKVLNVSVEEIWQGLAPTPDGTQTIAEPSLKYSPSTARLSDISILTWREAAATAQIPALLGGNEPDLFLLAVESDDLAPQILRGDRLIFSVLEAPQTGNVVLARPRHKRKPILRHFALRDRKTIHLTGGSKVSSPSGQKWDDFDFIYPAIELFRRLKK